jgi:hypothetical protein
MRRFPVVAVTVLILISLTASGALAGIRISRVQFTALGGSTALATQTLDGSSGGDDATDCDVDCTGLQLNSTGKITGIGNKDAVVTLIASGQATTICTRHDGYKTYGHKPPHMSTIGVDVIAKTEFTNNGNAPLDVTTSGPPTTLPGSKGGCPDDSWTAEIISITFHSARVIIRQNGVVTLDETFDLTA